MSMKLKALVVEDDPGARRTYVRLLSRQDLVVSDVPNKESAISLLQKEYFHLAWLDLSLQRELAADQVGRDVLNYIVASGDDTLKVIVTGTGKSADLANALLTKYGADL